MTRNQPRLQVTSVTIGAVDPGHVPPTWPTMDGQQQTQEHLDIYVEDLEASTDWAVHCGARLAMHQPQERVRVLFDPQGHPFCLFTD